VEEYINVVFLVVNDTDIIEVIKNEKDDEEKSKNEGLSLSEHFLT